MPVDKLVDVVALPEVERDTVELDDDVADGEAVRDDGRDPNLAEL
jgi:hypothetical protein